MTLSLQIKDYHRLVDQLAYVVRPGGLIDLCEYDFQTYDIEGNVIEVENSDSPPSWAKWLFHLRTAFGHQGRDIYAARDLLYWMEHNSAFVDIVYKEFFLPVVPVPRTADTTDLDVTIEEGQMENCLVG